MQYIFSVFQVKIENVACETEKLLNLNDHLSFCDTIKIKEMRCNLARDYNGPWATFLCVYFIKIYYIYNSISYVLTENKELTCMRRVFS